MNTSASKGPPKTPAVSIGLPVYNGERYLREALDSLLAQTYTDFELVICDNASTDSTRSICEDYAGRDSRIRYYRNNTNVGAVKNFQRAIELATAPYFMWASDDDLHRPNFLGRCVAVLTENPTAVLACTGARFIDEDGDLLGESYSDFRGLDAGTIRRVAAMVARAGGFSAVCIYGLMRRDAFLRTSMVQNVWGPDNVLLIELLLHGPFAIVDEELFLYRTYQAKSADTIIELLDPANVKGGWKYPVSDMCGLMYAAVANAGLYWPVRTGARIAFGMTLAFGNPRLAKKLRIERRTLLIESARSGPVLRCPKYFVQYVTLAITGRLGRLLATAHAVIR